MTHSEQQSTHNNFPQHPGYTCSLCGHVSYPVFTEVVMAKYSIEYCRCSHCNYVEAGNQLLLDILRGEFREGIHKVGKMEAQNLEVAESANQGSRESGIPKEQSTPRPISILGTNSSAINTEIPLFGIALFHGIGDILCSTPIPRQLKQDYPGCRIVFYTSERLKFALENNPYIDELIALPGVPLELDETVDELKKERPWTRFFTPAPYMNYDREPGADLFELTKAAAGMEFSVPYQPVMQLTDTEVQQVQEYWNQLARQYHPSRKRILVETEFQSEQTPWDESYARAMIEALRHLQPVFIITAKNKPAYFDALKAVYADIEWCNLPFRHNAELFNRCDAFVGVSSGISCLAQSTWCRNDVPRIEVVHGTHWSTWHYKHHSKRRFCFDSIKFLRCLEWLDEVLQGKIDGSEQPEDTLMSLFITNINAKYHEVSPAMLPFAHGREQRLRSMLLALNGIEPFVLIWGGIGDALLALSRIADESTNITVVAVPNSPAAMKSLLDTFPNVKKVYMLPMPTDHKMSAYTKMVLARTKTCLGCGVTPMGNESELWNERLDIFRSCGVKEHPNWVQAVPTLKLQEYQVVIAPRGSMYGVFRSKRNVINPRYWKALLEFFRLNGISPVVIGTPEEAEYYPLDEHCINKRSYDIQEQMRIIAGADILVAADSWHKTFAALADIPSIVFAPLTGHDLAFVKDTSHYAFITPWRSITLVHTLDEAINTFVRMYRRGSAASVLLASLPVEHTTQLQSRVSELPRRQNPQQYLTSLHPVFWERRYAQIQNLLIRCSTALGDSLMITAVIRTLKEQFPHLRIAVSGSAATEMVMRHNKDIECFVLRNSAEEFAIEAIADDVIEYNHILDQLPEYYNGLHFMDILGNIAGISLPNRDCYYTATPEEHLMAERLYLRSFGKKGKAFSDSLTVGLHLYTEKDEARSYVYASLLIELLRTLLPGVRIINLGAHALQKNPDGILDCPKYGIGLREQIALAQYCDAFISIDSAFYHIAHNLLRKPTLLIQSVTNEALIGNPALGLTRPIRNTEKGCTACYWSSSCDKKCLSTLHPGHIAHAFVAMLEDYLQGRMPLWSPSFNDDMHILWDSAQHNYVATMLPNRSTGKTCRVRVHSSNLALPVYAHQWNGVEIKETKTHSDNTIPRIQAAPLQQSPAQSSSFSPVGNRATSLHEAFQRTEIL